MPGNAGVARRRSPGVVCSASSASCRRRASTSSSTSARRICAAAMPVLARLGLPLLVHAELAGASRRRRPVGRPAQPSHLAGDAAAGERARRDRAADRAGARRTACTSTSSTSRRPDALESLRAARREGLPVTVETCPHYLTFCADEIADGATAFKCAPPIREPRQPRSAVGRARPRRHRSRGHRPFPGPAGAQGDRGRRLPAAPGAASPRCSSDCRRSGPAPSAAATPSNTSRDGSRRHPPGSPACTLAKARSSSAATPTSSSSIRTPPSSSIPRALLHRHPITPYAGMRLRGVVEQTMLRGESVRTADGDSGEPSPSGELIYSAVASRLQPEGCVSDPWIRDQPRPVRLKPESRDLTCREPRSPANREPATVR